MSLEELRAGGKRALAEALARLETAPEAAQGLALLDAAWAAPKGVAIGITGPPGVGKSTLISALIGTLRREGRTVGVIAVDPSSRKSGGALLGDRARIATDPQDRGLFVRSMAARNRLGGLADLALPALALMRAIYDVTILETVGVGQSETDVRDVADLVVFCVQPASGDALQFMKAGVVEIPDIAVVTKADLGAPARRALADVKGALSLAADGAGVEALLVAADEPESVARLAERLFARAEADPQAFATAREAAARAWAASAIRERFGREGLAHVAARLAVNADAGPFTAATALIAGLREKLRS